MELRPGDELSGTPYKIVRLVGAGGMGAVYEVEHVRLGKRYMAKTLHPGLLSRADLVLRMEREAQTLARIAHPNIVEVHDLGVTKESIPYFIMEKLVGADLRRLLRMRTRIEMPVAVSIVGDVLEALAHTHREGVIHRDIKPENIFLARDGVDTRTKVLDFGIVHVLDDGRGLTGERFIGTYQYAPPEQIRGEKPTDKGDLYAVGCVLFELLAGRPPFHFRDQGQLMKAHLEKPAPRVSTLVDVPPRLDDLVAMCLQKKPADRPENALWLAGQLHILKKELKSLPVAQANTTEETLLTAITAGASDSDRALEAARPADTQVDTAPPFPLDGNTVEDRPRAEGLVDTVTEPASPPRAGSTLPEGQTPRAKAVRGVETRTAAPEPRVPTERFSDADAKAVASPDLDGSQSPTTTAASSYSLGRFLGRPGRDVRLFAAGLGIGLLIFAAYFLTRSAPSAPSSASESDKHAPAAAMPTGHAVPPIDSAPAGSAEPQSQVVAASASASRADAPAPTTARAPDRAASPLPSPKASAVPSSKPARAGDLSRSF